MVYLPRDSTDRRACEDARREGHRRRRPALARLARCADRQRGSYRRGRAARPSLRSARSSSPATADMSPTFERKLYVIRRRAENAVHQSAIAERQYFYVPSLSCRTIIYKGLLLPDQVGQFSITTWPMRMS
ncbi:MAG: hypothetical protein MPW14_23790 [Candidatus Manganitrophus sp.]|nr:MAG: hypothetical protein MPW14_23790 [Candidatus Manganitrophus sp.]